MGRRDRPAIAAFQMGNWSMNGHSTGMRRPADREGSANSRRMLPSFHRFFIHPFSAVGASYVSWRDRVVERPQSHFTVPRSTNCARVPFRALFFGPAAPSRRRDRMTAFLQPRLGYCRAMTQSYSDEFISGILTDTKTIAVVVEIIS